MFIHRPMLFADHVQPHPVWYQLDPGEGDGQVVVIMPDASHSDIENFVRKLYSPGEDVFFTAAQNTPVLVPGTPDVFHTAVPQTPQEPQTEFVDHSGMTKRQKKQQLDMMNVRLSLLKLQRNEALTNNDRETAMKVMRSMDQTREEKQKLEDELEASNTSEEGSDVKDDVEDNNNNADADPESGEGSTPLNQTEDVDVETEVKFEVKEEDDEDDNNVAPDPLCTQCGAVFKSKAALVIHRVQVHNKSLKICDICGKSCDGQKGLSDHRRNNHKKIECDICHKKFQSSNFKKHRSTCHQKHDQEHPEQHQCFLCDFSSDIQSCLTKHIKKEHQFHPVTHQCNHVSDGIRCEYVTKDKSNLNRHIKMVHFNVKYNCDSCKRTFTSSEVLERHVRNAHQVKAGAGPLLFHNMETPKEDTWYPCNKCDYKSKIKCNTEKHKKTHLKTAKPIPECIYCGQIFKKAAYLKKHLDKCKKFVSLKVGQEDAVELMTDANLNQEQVKKVLKVIRKKDKSKVEPNILKNLNESVKDLGEKWFKSEKIKLKDSNGKQFVTGVTYCKDVKGFLKFIKKGRKCKNVRYLISADGGMYDTKLF